MTSGPPSRATLRSPLVLTGLVLLGFVLVMAAFAPLLTSYDPRAVSGPVLDRPSARHWLGTDIPGRDILAQLLFGARSSLAVAVLAGSLTMAGAIALGVAPALVGGWVDSVANRFTVFALALPGLPLLILIGTFAGQSRIALILAIGAIGMAPNARVLRGQTLSLRRRGYVASARGFGGGPLYVLRRHVIPELAPLVVVGFVNWAGLAVGLEAGLAFLGLGDPSGVSWGLMLNRALSQQSLYFSPLWVWWVLPAGFAVTLTVLAFTFVGVGIEPTFNPRWLRTA